MVRGRNCLAHPDTALREDILVALSDVGRSGDQVHPEGFGTDHGIISGAHPRADFGAETGTDSGTHGPSIASPPHFFIGSDAEGEHGADDGECSAAGASTKAGSIVGSHFGEVRAGEVVQQVAVIVFPTVASAKSLKDAEWPKASYDDINAVDVPKAAQPDCNFGSEFLRGTSLALGLQRTPASKRCNMPRRTFIVRGPRLAMAVWSRPSCVVGGSAKRCTLTTCWRPPSAARSGNVSNTGP